MQGCQQGCWLLLWALAEAQSEQVGWDSAVLPAAALGLCWVDGLPVLQLWGNRLPQSLHAGD